MVPDRPALPEDTAMSRQNVPHICQEPVQKPRPRVLVQGAYNGFRYG